jgi:hypothetical protein
MPLIPYADTESLTGNPREVFATLKNKLNIFAMIANAQTCLAPTRRLHKRAGRRAGSPSV